MRRPSAVGLFLISTLSVSHALAFEVGTHKQLSLKSSQLSDLRSYLGDELRISWDSEFSDGKDRRIAEAWIAEGSVLEDGWIVFPVWPRPANHFYNPLTGEGYENPLFPFPAYPSPFWALEELAEDVQEFSYKDARLDFWDGLTAADPAMREVRVAHLFRSLGQVIHHLQDMAQPQHTRGDSHVGLPGFGDKSFFETFTEEKRELLPYTGYPAAYGEADPATFNRVRSFWHTADGLGMADYSNREFVSAGTNFRAIPGVEPLPDYSIVPAPGLPAPNGQQATVDTRRIEDLAADEDLPNSLRGEIDFVLTPVADRYLGTTADARRTSTYGLFDDKLQEAGAELRFTLNRFNFRDAHQLLIPRAVGYSAGLINYFFRGRLDLRADPNSPDGYIIRNLGTERMVGTFALYYDAIDGQRYLVPGAEWAETLAPAGSAGDEVSVPGFSTSLSPPPKVGSGFMLVFRGDMGEETDDDGSIGAVAAKVVPSSQFFVLAQKACGADCGAAGWDCPLHYYTATYYSTALDQGWERIGDGPRMPWPYWSGNHSNPGVADYFRYGDYVRDDLLLLGQSFVWASRDGGATFAIVSGFADLPNGIEYPTEWRNGIPWNGGESIFIDSMTFVGGTELLAAAQMWAADGSTGATDVVLYSPDLGVTWSVRATVPAKSVRAVGAGKVLASSAKYRSVDSGLTWQVVQPQVDGAAPYWSMDSMAWNQREGPDSVILATGYVWSDPSGGDRHWRLWKSEDGGASWRRIPVATGLASSNDVPTSIAMSPSGEALLVINDVTAPEQFAHIFRSRDAGESWQPASDPSGGYALGVLYLGQGLPGAPPSPALPLPPPPVSNALDFNYLWHLFHATPCTPLQPPDGGSGPAE